MINAYWEDLEFEIPPVQPTPWRIWIDTGLPPPRDIQEFSASTEITSKTYRTKARSTVFLISRLAAFEQDPGEDGTRPPE
jgi:glycogen operon protein